LVFARGLGAEFVAEEVETKNAGNHDDEGNQKFERSCKDNAALPLGE
jgi:hypothetical protein